MRYDTMDNEWLFHYGKSDLYWPFTAMEYGADRESIVPLAERLQLSIHCYEGGRRS